MTALSSSVVSIVDEVDRADLRSRLGAGACGPGAASRPVACDELADRYEQRNVLLGMAIGSGIATGLFAGATWIAFRLESSSTSPRIVPMASLNGGRIALLGAW